MVRDQCPRIAGGSSLLEDECKAPEEIVPVTIVMKEEPPLYPPRDDMVEGTSGIDTGCAGHAELIGRKLKI